VSSHDLDQRAWASQLVTDLDTLAPDPAGDGIWRIRPRSARAWSTDALDDGTGWTFTEV